MFSERFKLKFPFVRRWGRLHENGKILFSMDQASWARLEALRNTLQVASAAEVIRQALTLLSLAAKTAKDRGQVILRAEDGIDTIVEIGLPLNNTYLPRNEYAGRSHAYGILALLSMVPRSRGYDALMAYIGDPHIGATALSPIKFCEVLNVDPQTLADLAHVHRDTLTGGAASEDLQRFLRQALQVLRAAFDLSGDINKAAFWYRNEPLSPFNYNTAERLVSENRTNDVLSYVASLEAGATGGVGYLK